jgi:ParB family chromosome partitioning protein
VSNLLRLLNLAQPVQTMLMAGDIDMGHARALLSVDAGTQISLANMIIARRLSVREDEKLVAHALAEGEQPRPAPREKPRDILRLEEELSDALATQVAIKVSARNKGQLVIDFANLDALDGVIARLRR